MQVNGIHTQAQPTNRPLRAENERISPTLEVDLSSQVSASFGSAPPPLLGHDNSPIVDLTHGERLVPTMEFDRSVAQALLSAEEVPVAWNSEQDDKVPELADESMPESGKMWYVILVGTTPGVFGARTWFAPNTHGEQVIHCNTQAEAEYLFDAALDAGIVARVQDVSTRTTMTRMEFPVGKYN